MRRTRRTGSWTRAHDAREQALEALTELLIAGVLARKPWMSRAEAMHELVETWERMEE